ncbi:MAG: heparinase II/III family protein [Opitutaceae bacterium]|jgi:hypothetical protein
MHASLRLFVFPLILFPICAGVFTGIARGETAPLTPLEPGRVDYFASVLPEAPGGIGRPADDREAWARVASFAPIQKLKADAEAVQTEAVAPLPDDLFLEVSRTGSRIGYERAFRRRTELLSLFTLAECIENQGRYLPAIETYLAAILTEKTWVAPAHDTRLINFNQKVIEVDLGSSARAWTIATVDYWLGDRLKPETRALIRSEIRRRVFDPYLQVVRSAKIPPGTGGWWWLTGTNNWNAVCNAGVVGAGLALLPSREERATLVAGAEHSMKYFLSGYTSDGYCSEGLGYWDYGFGSYLMMAETVSQATGGAVDFLQDPKVRVVATYPEKLEILSGVYPAYADSGPTDRPTPWMLDLLNRRLKLGHSDWVQTQPADMPFRHGMGARLFGVGILAFLPRETTEGGAISAYRLRDSFPEAQVFALRPRADASVAMGVSFKGGNNAEHHNHNDLGSYVVVVGKSAPLLDAGMESYTRRTFSPQRYESKMLSSYGHAVPMVDGKLQSAGEQFAAKVLSTEFTPDQDTVVLDLRAGYEVPTLKTLTRTFVYSRVGTGSFQVRDTFAYDKPESFGTALITYGPVRQMSPDTLVIGEGSGAVRVIVDTHGAEFTFNEEVIQEQTPNNRHPTRIGINLKEPTSSGVVEMTITPVITDKNL